MTDLRSHLHGLWLPLVTPFRNGELDKASLSRLVRHYAELPIDGVILAATSGEGMTLGIAELERVVALTRTAIAENRRYLPICLGLSGSDTRKMQDALDERLKVDVLADSPGPSLFHCHHQLHMDFGFMALFRYA